MQRHLQTIMVVVVALAGMAAIGYSYEKCIGPSHPIWLERAHIWSNPPLAVGWDRDFWGEAHSESFATAVRSVNSELGCTVLDINGFIDVEIRSADGEPCEQGTVFYSEDADEEAWLCPGETAQIQIASPGTNNCSARIAMHGLGHVLGLAHAPTGIMRYGGGCDDLMVFSDAQRARERTGSARRA